jgi:hypothetical protein
MTTTSDEEVNRSRRINDATGPDVVPKCCTWKTGKMSTVKVIYAGRQMEERRGEERRGEERRGEERRGEERRGERRGEERRALQEHHLCVAAV